MKKISNFSLFVLMLVALLRIDIYSQQCELVTSNVIFESSNSLTFDVYVKNTGSTSWTYSHSSLAWNYDPAFLNGGVPTFSIVPGYSQFPAAGQPPSALITNPNVLRTSSNMPGSNGTVLPGQSLRLQKFRLQTSATSFSGSYFNLTWKNSIVPYTRAYSWNSGTGLPVEVAGVSYSIQQLLFEENFDYAVGDSLNGLNGWIVQPTASYVNSIKVVSPGLTYAGYPSVSGNSAKVDTAGQDIYHTITSQTSGSVYAAFLVNVTKATTTGEYFFHFTQTPGSTTFVGRVYAKLNGTDVSFGLSKGTETPVYTTAAYPLNTTQLIVLKYTFNTGTTTDDSMYLFVNPTIGAAEPTPTLSFASGLADLTQCSALNLRQGGAANAPRLTLDGIRVGLTWTEVLALSGQPLIGVSPSLLTGFSYSTGAGPSASQSYNLSASNLSPASGNITVTGSANYEVSLNNSSFTSSVNVGYTAGTLLSTPIYVRLKAGLPGGVYNGEVISNAGGGATTMNVTCNGVVSKPEPTNHVTGFAGVNGNPAYYLINTNWTDASGGTVPDGYLIKVSKVGFASIVDPVDGTPETDAAFVKNVAQGLQTAAFGLNSDTLYYFKIYPYTNSGSLINYKTDGSVPQFSLATATAPALPFVENFEYTTGSNLTANGWISHSAGGTNPIQVAATPLTYTGYFASGVGKSVTMTTSGEDDNHAFSSVNSGSMYGSFMVNISSAQLTGDYLFHFAPENSSSLFFGKVFVKADASNNLAFGIAKNVNGSVVYTPFSYALNTTYLVVVKYIFNPATANDDTVKLWINPVLDGNEPSSDLTQTDAGNDALSLGMLALRQGSASNAAVLSLGGIRAATTWIPGSGSSTFQLSVSVNNGWNMVSVPGSHPVDQNVTTWWAGKDPSAGVFRFSSGYQSVTVAAPGTGYWMKHIGTTTYNTGEEWPAGGINVVSHDPITASTGWNLIGGYEQSVLTSGITTVPAGLQTGQVFGYSAGYTPATNLVPGYGYWIKLTGAGQINIPNTLFKGLPKSSETVAQDWGKIIITDNSGKSYTLYNVKGEVNLDNFELPPAPPVGMFDVRFGTNRYAEKLNVANQTIELNSLEYPIKIRVDNVNIKLQDESGKTVNTRMKSGEDFVINNSSVSKLLVSLDIIPDKFAIEQNYPNPFNPSTTVQFDVPAASQVAITIYDMLGQEVRTLFAGQIEAGTYKIQWDGTNNAGQQISSGTYIYRMIAGDFVQTKKMILLK